MLGYKYYKKMISYLVSFTMLIMMDVCYAGKSLGEISDFATGIAGGLGKILYAIAFVLGASFLIGSIIQYKQHRENPQMVRLSNPVIYFILGLSLIALPFIAMLSDGSTLLR